jgi:hypothetical protein
VARPAIGTYSGNEKAAERKPGRTFAPPRPTVVPPKSTDAGVLAARECGAQSSVNGSRPASPVLSTRLEVSACPEREGAVE